jgi:hypothetical protein
MSITTRGAQAGTVLSFSGTSTIQTTTIPLGVRRIEVYLWGAGGRSGGAGGFVSGQLDVVPSQVLQIIVGVVSDINGAVLAKGNGGGYQNFRNVGFGGGFSGIFNGFPTQDTALAIAGGGGGGTARAGGGGGYTAGGNGTANGGNAGGGGGTQTAGGAGSGGIAESGFALTGGDGNGVNDFSAGSGGGGWFGGGGGRNGSGAGGGSSFIDRLLNATFENGGSGTNVTGPAQTNMYWQSPAGNTNSSGLIVIVYANIFPLYQVIRPPNNLPTTIPGCQLWLDANDPSNTGIVPSNGATITTWVDKSGNSRSMTATGSVTLSTYGGINSILFNNSYMRVNSPVNLLSFTVFAVSRCQTARNNQNALLAIPLTLSEFDSPDGFGMFIDSDAVNRRDRFFATRNANVVNNSNPAGTDAYPLRMMCWTATATATVLRSWFNGNTGSTSSTAQNRTSTATGFGIGFSITGSGGIPTNITCVSQFSEFIVYNNVLTTAQRQLIEGYLAWKWGLQSSLPASHRFRIRIPLTLTMKSFTPAKFSGLALWLDGADPATIILSGLNVTQWNDKSGGGFNAVQITSNYYPTYNSATNTISCSNDGVNPQFLDVPQGMQTTQPVSIFSVVSWTQYSASGYTFLDKRKAATLTPLYQMTGQGVAFRDNSTLTNSAWTLPQNTPNIIGVQATLNTQRTFVNGTTQIAFSSNLNMPAADTFTFRIGALNEPVPANIASVRTFSASSQINEVIVYNSFLTIDQRQQVEGYLAWKWGLRSSLPNSNFYKFYQPAP